MEKEQIRLTLFDFLDTSVDELVSAGHISGPKCRCTGASGLNSRDEIVGAVRGNFKM